MASYDVVFKRDDALKWTCLHWIWEVNKLWRNALHPDGQSSPFSDGVIVLFTRKTKPLTVHHKSSSFFNQRYIICRASATTINNSGCVCVGVVLCRHETVKWGSLPRRLRPQEWNNLNVKEKMWEVENIDYVNGCIYLNVNYSGMMNNVPEKTL